MESVFHHYLEDASYKTQPFSLHHEENQCAMKEKEANVQKKGKTRDRTRESWFQLLLNTSSIPALLKNVIVCNSVCCITRTSNCYSLGLKARIVY